MYRNLLISVIFISSGCGHLSSGTPAVPASPPTRAERSEALLQALLAIGIDYSRGGKSPATGFDCSGLVAYVYREAWGIRLPATTTGQSQAGVPVSLADLQAGDLLFYDTLQRPYSHVGIYLGEGKFVHAPKSGAQVRIESLQASYWATRFNGARRVEPGT